VWTGKVSWVDDGDTLDAVIPGDGRGRVRVRFAGVQAMELTSYRAGRRAGDCHALDATSRVERLVKRSKGRIRVSAQYPQSRAAGRRLRSVSVRLGGRWRDVGRILLSEGLALWWPGHAEDASNARYIVLAQKAAAAGRGVYSPNACGLGPSEGHPLGLTVHWDADGIDQDNLDGEYVKVRNYDPVNWLPLGGWWIRDSGLPRFTFPAGAAVAPGGSVTVHVGAGEDGGGEYFWNRTAPLFGNPSLDDPSAGDGAYLFDPQGDLRASMIYPCRVGCTNPAQGRIALAAQPRGDEYVALTNTGDSTLDLEPLVLAKAPFSYAFAAGTALGPGQTLRVHTRGDPAQDTASDLHWGMSRPILRDDGDVATLSTYNDIPIACTAYGSRSC
jgi:endonuclease YncB( thermonuclease family)